MEPPVMPSPQYGDATTAAATAAASPEHVHALHRPPGERRAHTLPAKWMRQNLQHDAASETRPDTVERLFTCPHAKVVSFGAQVGRPGSSSGPRPPSASASAGALPWTSPLEKTLAAGPLTVYRVPSTGVSFLSSGPLLHPILRASQCWLVDAAGRFALRVRDGSFYRIELPHGSEQEQGIVEEFKTVLARVLQYEKTPSPFRTGYRPEMEEPRTPVREPGSRPKDRAKRWRMNGIWEPEDPEHRARWSPANRQEEEPASWRRHLRPRPGTAGSNGSDESRKSAGSAPSTDEEAPARGDSNLWARANSRNSVTNDAASDGSLQDLPTFTLPLRSRPMQTRSITAPVQLAIETNPTALSRTAMYSSMPGSASSHTSSTSFYSAVEPDEASHHRYSQDLSRSLSDEAGDQQAEDCEEDEVLTPKRHPQQGSASSILPQTLQAGSHTTASHHPTPTTPTFSHTSLSPQDTPPSSLSSRTDPLTPDHISTPRDPTGRPQHSLFASKQLFPPTGSPSARKRFTASLVQRAYSLFLTPGSLARVMLDVAAWIAKGGAHPGIEGRVPGSWEVEGETEEEEEWWSEEEDDYGVPLGKVVRSSGDGGAAQTAGIGSVDSLD